MRATHPCPTCKKRLARKNGRSARGAQRLECGNPACTRRYFTAPRDRYRSRYPHDPTRKKYMRAYRARQRRTVYFKSGRTDWETPAALFHPVEQEFGFSIDVCASAENTKCPRYWTVQDNALEQDWSKEVCFMNPPYRHPGIADWVKKAWDSAQAGATVVALLPGRLGTRWWQQYIHGQPTVEQRPVHGRVQFVGSEYPAPFPSVWVIFRPSAVSHQGATVIVPPRGLLMRQIASESFIVSGPSAAHLVPALISLAPSSVQLHTF